MQRHKTTHRSRLSKQKQNQTKLQTCCEQHQTILHKTTYRNGWVYKLSFNIITRCVQSGRVFSFFCFPTFFHVVGVVRLFSILSNPIGTPHPPFLLSGHFSSISDGARAKLNIARTYCLSHALFFLDALQLCYCLLFSMLWITWKFTAGGQNKNLAKAQKKIVQIVLKGEKNTSREAKQ